MEKGEVKKERGKRKDAAGGKKIRRTSSKRQKAEETRKGMTKKVYTPRGKRELKEEV